MCAVRLSRCSCGPARGAARKVPRQRPRGRVDASRGGTCVRQRRKHEVHGSAKGGMEVWGRGHRKNCEWMTSRVRGEAHCTLQGGRGGADAPCSETGEGGGAHARGRREGRGRSARPLCSRDSHTRARVESPHHTSPSSLPRPPHTSSGVCAPTHTFPPAAQPGPRHPRAAHAEQATVG